MTDAHPELANLLENLRSEGTFQSHGSFTLDLVHAREKLKKFQLLDPYHYVLPLVSAVVLGGGSTLRCRVGPARFSMEFDGTPFTVEELEGMFSVLLVGSSPVAQRRVAELAVGINAALSLSPRQVSLVSVHPDQVVKATFTARKQQVETTPPPEKAQPWTRIEVQHAGMRALWRKTQRDAPEVLALHQRCRLANLELTVNDLSFPPQVGWESHSCLVASYLRAGEARKGCEITIGKLSSRVDPPRTDVTAGPYSAVVTLGGEAPQELVFVHHGLIFRRPDLSLGPGTRAAIWAPELRRNLSHTELVQDESFELIVEQLKLEIFRMLTLLEGRFAELPDPDRQEAVDCLQRLVGFRMQHDEVLQALKLARLLIRARPAGSLPALLDDYVVALIEQRDPRKNDPAAVQLRLEQTLGALARAHGLELKRIVLGARDDSAVSRFTFDGPFPRVETLLNRLLATEEQLFGLAHEHVQARMQSMVTLFGSKRPARARELKITLNELQRPMELALESQARYHGKQLSKVSLRD
ncbi:MAG: hypothetical protein AMXMBFR33_45210 [Candidatus Xenobia bacterium]